MSESTPSMKDTQAPKKAHNLWIVAIVVAVIIIAWICCIGSYFSRNEDDKQEGFPTNPTSAISDTPIPPTITPSDLTMFDIERNYENLTKIQWKEYAQSLKGLRVRWTGSIEEVYDNGNINLDVGEEFFHGVSLKGVPLENVKILNKGQVIEFTATIKDVSTFLGLYVYLIDPFDIVIH